MSVIDWKLWLLDLDGKGLGGFFYIGSTICVYAYTPLPWKLVLNRDWILEGDTFIGVE